MTEPSGEVVRAAKNGDLDAFGHLVRMFQGRLFGLVLMMVRDTAGAEDVVRDSFVRAYAHLGDYDENRPLYPWLATIAVRLAQNWLHHRQRTVRREGSPLQDAGDPAATADSLAALVGDERRRELWRAVALPSGERTAVVLFYRDELSVGDIARAIGVTSGTIKTLLFRARRHLRTHLEALAAPHEDPSA